MGDITGNEDKEYYEENPEYELVEEIVENIAEEKVMDKNAHEGFLISD